MGAKKADDFSFEKFDRGLLLSAETLVKVFNFAVVEKNEFHHPAEPKVTALFAMRLSQNKVFRQKHFR